MPGYPSELFLDSPPDLYVCGICHDILKSPKQCMQGHTYCTDCIRTHLAIKRACPVCICPLTEASMANCLLLRDLIGRMPVRCPTTLLTKQDNNFSEEAEVGCDWTGPMNDQEEHINLNCPYAATVCANIDCGLLVQKRHLQQHDSICHYKLHQCHQCEQFVKRVHHRQHDDICEQKPVQCPLGCGASTVRKEVEAHLTNACPLQQVICSYEGCGELTERRRLNDHQAACRHKTLQCPLCDNFVKRMDEEYHVTNSCPKRPTSCPRECGAVVPFDALPQHLSTCPLEEVDCPHAAATGCSAACPGRLCRRDLEAHLADPCTLARAVKTLQHQALQYQQVITRLNQQSQATRNEFAKTIAELHHQFTTERNEHKTTVIRLLERAQAREGATLQILKKMHNITWDMPPCAQSDKVLTAQLSQEKRVAGGLWRTYHLVHEFPGQVFTELTTPFRLESARVCLRAGESASVVIQSEQIDNANCNDTENETEQQANSLGCYLFLSGFRGEAHFTITAFRFGRGPPMWRICTHVWEFDEGWGYGNFFTREDIANGWLQPGSPLQVLVTVHLKRS